MAQDIPPGTDPDLMAAALQAIGSDPELDITDLSVEFIEGTLVLRGSAGSAEQRDRAADVVRIATGGAPVENRIRT